MASMKNVLATPTTTSSNEHAPASDIPTLAGTDFCAVGVQRAGRRDPSGKADGHEPARLALPDHRRVRDTIVHELADLAGVELTLSQAARLFPGRPHKCTIMRWIVRGVKVGGKGTKGTLVKLRGMKSGGRWYVTPRAISEFRRITSQLSREADQPEGRAGSARGITDSRRRHRTAMANLRAMGVKV